MLTSLYYHGVGDWVSTVLDRSAVLALIGYGGYVFATKLTAGGYRSSLAALVMATFLLSGYLYFYGRQEGAYCFDADPMIANSWHTGLHAASALDIYVLCCFEEIYGFLFTVYFIHTQLVHHLQYTHLV